MSFRAETAKFIREETDLTPAQKRALIQLVDKHRNNLHKLARWIRALHLITRPFFGALFLFQRLEVIRWAKEGLEASGPSLDFFQQILAIIFCAGSGTNDQGGYGAFAAQALVRLREETHLKVKTAMVELLLSLPAGSPVGLQPKDYRAGLHHADDLVRCRTLLTLHREFGSEGLLVVLREIDLVGTTPSLFFRGTLGHLFRQHPELIENPEMRSMYGSKLKDLLQMDALKRLKEPPDGIRYPSRRLAYRLSCTADGFPDNPTSIKEEKEGALRLERFKRMGHASGRNP